MIVFSLTPAVVLVVVAEIVATLSIVRGSRVIADPATGGSIYTMRIGRWPWSRQAVTPLNSHGFPDREFPVAAHKDDCATVVFSGDSFVYGDGVDRDSSFVEIVRRRLATPESGRCIRVFNIGVRGTTIDRQSDRILETLERLQPDVVILGQYQNDLMDLGNPGAILGPPPPSAGSAPRRTPVSLPVFHANIIKLLTYQSMAFMIRNDIKRDELRRWSVMADSSRSADARRFQDTYSRLFAALADTLAARNVAFGVIIIPSKLDVLAKRFPEEAFFLELAQRHDIPFLRIFPLLDAQRSPYAFLTYDGHLSEHGNRLVADAIFDWLLTSAPAPFSLLRQRQSRRGEAVPSGGPP